MDSVLNYDLESTPHSYLGNELKQSHFYMSYPTDKYTAALSSTPGSSVRESRYSAHVTHQRDQTFRSVLPLVLHFKPHVAVGIRDTLAVYLPVEELS